MVQRISSPALKISNKIWTCRELNKNDFSYFNFSKFRIEFELKIEEALRFELL
jgi:hypothetical protein